MSVTPWTLKYELSIICACHKKFCLFNHLKIPKSLVAGKVEGWVWSADDGFWTLALHQKQGHNQLEHNLLIFTNKGYLHYFGLGLSCKDPCVKGLVTACSSTGSWRRLQEAGHGRQKWGHQGCGFEGDMETPAPLWGEQLSAFLHHNTKPPDNRLTNQGLKSSKCEPEQTFLLF